MRYEEAVQRFGEAPVVAHIDGVAGDVAVAVPPPEALTGLPERVWVAVDDVARIAKDGPLLLIQGSPARGWNEPATSSGISGEVIPLRKSS